MKNVCVIGYGAIGPIHADALGQVENAKLYGVCDIDPEVLKHAKETYPDVVCYDNYDDVLADSNVHSVHICTPHYLHAPMVKQALKAGKEIICEKPIAITRDEFEDLLATPGIENVALVFQNRLNPCAVKLREIIESGEMGELKATKAIVTWCRDESYYESGEWRGKWATEGGGVLINQSIHTLDILCHLGGEVVDVDANMHNYSLKDVIEVEDTCVARLKYKNSNIGIFFATNGYSYTNFPQIEFVFEKGIVRYMEQGLFVGNEKVASDEMAVYGKACWGVGHLGLFVNYYDCGEYYDIYSAKNTMETMYSIYEKSLKGGKVE